MDVLRFDHDGVAVVARRVLVVAIRVGAGLVCLVVSFLDLGTFAGNSTYLSVPRSG